MARHWGPFSKQPNILIILTDQQRSEQHFPAGWSEINLPWMTRLQKTGVTFRRGMVSTTACSPSRSTIFTSTYPTINGVKKVDDTLQMDQTLYTGGKLTTLGQVMRDAGYQVLYKGKWHLDGDISTMSKIRPAYEDIMMIEDDAMEAEWSFPGWTSPDLGTGETAIGTSMTKPAQYSALNTLGGGRVNNDARIVNGPLYSPRQQTPVDFLRNHHPNNDPPFFMVVSMANPHDIWVYPYSYMVAGYTDPVWRGPAYAGFQLPDSFSQTDLSTKPSAQKDFLDAFQGGALAESEALAYVQFYAYLQTLVDSLTGDLLEAIKENKHGTPGQLERDTVVVRLSDHGEMAGAQAGLRQKENNCYNETMLVPMIFSNPLLPQGEPSQALVGLIDVLPTLAEIAGVEDPTDGSRYEIQGQSFAGMLLEPSASGRDQYLFATDDCDLSKTTSIRAIVEKDWKYAVYYSADYDSTDNPNGVASNFEYEMYDYTSADGRSEITNLLYDRGLSIRPQAERLHRALTQLMNDSSTLPDDWPDKIPLREWFGL